MKKGKSTDFKIDRVPPYSIEAEKAVLGSCMIDPSCIDRIMGLITPFDFYKVEHQLIFKSYLSLVEKEIPTDLLSLSEDLKVKGKIEEIGGSDYLASLASEVPTASNAIRYAKIVLEKAVRRQLIDKAHKIMNSAYDEKTDVEVSLEEADKNINFILEGISEKKGDEKPVNLTDIADSFYDIYKSNDDGISLGIKELDEKYIKLAKGEIATIQAPTGGKKSMFAINMAHNLSKQGKKVLYVNLEMNLDDILKRLISISSGFDSYALKQKKLSDTDITYAVNKIKENNIRIMSPAAVTMSSLGRMIKLELKKNGTDIIILDHMHCIRSSIVDPVQKEVARIEGIKDIARKLDVPIITLIQINRFSQVNGKKPEKTDARGSSVIENTAAIMLALSNVKSEDMTLSLDKSSESEVAISVLKNRTGQDDYEIPTPYNWRNLRFGREEEVVEEVAVGDLNSLI